MIKERLLVSIFLFLLFLGPAYAEKDDYNSAPAILKALDTDKSCMEKVNLEAAKKEEIDELATCILAEIVKMGYPLCNQECLDQLTEDQLNKYFDMRAQQMKYILEKELERRIAEQIKRKQ